MSALICIYYLVLDRLQFLNDPSRDWDEVCTYLRRTFQEWVCRLILAFTHEPGSGELFYLCLTGSHMPAKISLHLEQTLLIVEKQNKRDVSWENKYN